MSTTGERYEFRIIIISFSYILLRTTNKKRKPRGKENTMRGGDERNGKEKRDTN